MIARRRSTYTCRLSWFVSKYVITSMINPFTLKTVHAVTVEDLEIERVEEFWDEV